MKISPRYALYAIGRGITVQTVRAEQWAEDGKIRVIRTKELQRKNNDRTVKEEREEKASSDKMKETREADKAGEVTEIGKESSGKERERDMQTTESIKTMGGAEKVANVETDK